MKVTVNEAEVATAPLPVVMDKACGKAGEKGRAGKGGDEGAVPLNSNAPMLGAVEERTKPR